MDTTDTWTSDDPYPSREALPGAPAAVGDIVAGRWRVAEVLKGGQAWVFIVDDVGRGIRRAIKVPMEDKVIAGDAELAMLFGIKPHQCVVSALDVTEVAGLRGIVLEYVPSTLYERLPVPVARPPATGLPLRDEVALALQQVCAGLAHLSAVTEVAHLDIKPSNVLIGDDGHAKVADFGLAEQVRIQNGHYPIARGKSWAYAAPEVLRNEPCDTRADIFSFGVMLYQACTGRYPYPEYIDKKLRDEKTDRAAQRKLLLDYYDSPGPRERTKEFYYWEGLEPTEFPVALSHGNINMLLSNCLGVLQENRNESFTVVEKLLATALRRPAWEAPPAALPDEDQRRRVLATSQALMRLGRLDEAISQLNLLLAEPLPGGLFADARDAAIEALRRAGRHDDAAALDAWR